LNILKQNFLVNWCCCVLLTAVSNTFLEK